MKRQFGRRHALHVIREKSQNTTGHTTERSELTTTKMTRVSEDGSRTGFSARDHYSITTMLKRVSDMDVPTGFSVYGRDNQ